MDFDCIVIGGGLAGLTAAAYLSRDGRKVAVYEQSQSIGGRASTQIKEGFHLNLGPHALYAAGAGASILGELGVAYRGTAPPLNRGRIVKGGRAFPMPSNLASILTSEMFSLPGKLELTKLFASLSSFDAAKIGDVTVTEWMARSVKNPGVRDFLMAMLRLSTYADCPARQSASAAITQFQLGLRSGVRYLDDGWQVLVDGLAEKIWNSHGSVQMSQQVAAVEHDARVRGVRLASGEFVAARSVILGVGPIVALKLVPAIANSEAGRIMSALVPVRLSTLDIGLRRLPDPKVWFGLGVDQPTYFSVHSAVAKLAPDEAALLHVGKYLGDSEANAAETERELEQFTDLLQPGWRNEVAVRRFLPNMVVSNALDTPGGRPNVAGAGIDGLYLAGDWVGSQGMLADAAMASAKLAAESAIAYAREAQSVGCNA